MALWPWALGAAAIWIFRSATTSSSSSSSSGSKKAAPPVTPGLPAKYSIPYRWQGVLTETIPTLEVLAQKITGDPNNAHMVPDSNPGLGMDPPLHHIFDLPIEWSKYIDQNGDSDGKGTIYPMCGVKAVPGSKPLSYEPFACPPGTKSN